jgi:glutamate dehydrogenase/leucine dehydrogenase
MARLSPIRARADFRSGPKKGGVRANPYPSKPRKIRVRAPSISRRTK